MEKIDPVKRPTWRPVILNPLAPLWLLRSPNVLAVVGLYFHWLLYFLSLFDKYVVHDGTHRFAVKLRCDHPNPCLLWYSCVNFISTVLLVPLAYTFVSALNLYAQPMTHKSDIEGRALQNNQ